MLFEYINSDNMLTVIATLFILFLIVKYIIRGGYKSVENLNSKAEQNFLKQLNRVLPNNYMIMAKVRLADIILPKNNGLRALLAEKIYQNGYIIYSPQC